MPTLLTCNYNTPDLIVNLVHSLRKVSSLDVLVVNTSDIASTELLEEHQIPFINLPGETHGNGVNFGLSQIKEEYVLLTDSDVLIRKDPLLLLPKMVEHSLVLMGRVEGDVGGKSLYPRVDPCFCFLNNDWLKSKQIRFFDGERTKNSRNSSRLYNIGSTLFEDVVRNNGKIGDLNVDGNYFKHYGGMSWHMQKYNPNSPDTDIDFGGTHPHDVYYRQGLVIREQYLKDLAHEN